jgi:hypothetical protein
MMTDILTAAQRVRRYLEDTQAGHDNLAELDKAQYFEISPSVYDAAWDSANILIDQEDPVIPVAAQLPASSCMLWHPDLAGNNLVWAFNFDHDGEKHVLFQILSDHRPPIHVGSYAPGSMHIRANDNVDGATKTKMAMNVVLGACLFELINEPRFVVREPVGTRQSRRAMKRQVPSFSPDGWSRIVWDLNKPVKGRDEFGSNRNFHMPLHFTRGYWRKAHAAAKTNVHVVRGERRQWVEGYWSGHPAYGIKKSVYAPTISGEK